MLELVRRLLMRKAFLIAIVLVLTGTAHAENFIRFPVSAMGAGLTHTFDITGHLDAETALGLSVTAIRLTPVMWFGGTLTITGITTMGSTLELAEPGNWLDFSDPTLLTGMTLDWTTINVSGNLIAGLITISSSADALGVMAIEVGHVPGDDGYLNEDGWTTFGTTYDGEISVVPIPEPATLALIGFGLLGMWRRRRGDVANQITHHCTGGQE